MAAWRCPTCFTNWPADDEFDECPECGDETWVVKKTDPDYTLDEALSEKNHILFKKFYEKWDARKPARRLRPTPEDDVRFPFRPKQDGAPEAPVSKSS